MTDWTGQGSGGDKVCTQSNLHTKPVQNPVQNVKSLPISLSISPLSLFIAPTLSLLSSLPLRICPRLALSSLFLQQRRQKPRPQNTKNETQKNKAQKDTFKGQKWRKPLSNQISNV